MNINSVPVSAYKTLTANDYRVTKFPVYASQTYTYTSASNSNSVDVQVLRGVKYTGSNDLRVPNFEYEMFDSIVQSFYSRLPYVQYGIASSSYYPSQSLYVVSVTQDIFGEEIKPGTFKVTVNNTSSFDDGKGNMYVSQSSIGYNIGHIFYDQGIAVFQENVGVSSSLDRFGLCIVSGTAVQVNFSSSVSLFEHYIRVKVEPNEFSMSPYTPGIYSASYTGSSATILDLTLSQSIKPYITSIGLYNSNNDLLAVAKVSNPIKRTFDTTQTFVIKFDT